VTTYASSQLVTANNVPIGTLCVFDPEHKEIDARMLGVLGELSKAAMDMLEARRHHDELEVSFTQLVDVQRELRRSNEHLSAFAGQVSHDLQGPLAGVMLALEMMEDELDDGVEFSPEHRAMFVQRALSSAERMRATVAGLLEFASLGGTITPCRLDMGVVVKDVVSDLAARLSGVRLDVMDLPDVCGDEVQVRAVMQNLVSNALKYAGAVPDPCISIGGAQGEQRSRITVSDNGPGVPRSQRESIFELLVRGDDTADSGIHGLGIGLATCRRIVQSHGGDLGVRDSAMGGAEFWFGLPHPASAV
jgi:signal transduction histidine kinase